MAETFKAGATSKTIDVFVPDSSSTVGAGLSGLAFNTAGLKCYYRKGATGTATAVTLATQTVSGAYSSGGFVEIDATNMKGQYRFDIPNAAIDTVGLTHLYFYGATNMAPVPLRIQCVGYDPESTTNLGLSALPTANPAANGGLATVDANNAVKVQSGTGTGQLDFTTGVVKANVTQFGGSAGTFTAGIPDVNAAKWVGGTPNALISGRVDANVQASASALTFNLTGNVSGSVGSVTGAVGSVTGSVGSVTGLTAANLDVAVSSRLAAASYSAPPAASAIATAIWQDATPGDFTTANSIGKSIYNAFAANTSVYTSAALANAPSGGGGSAAAVWNYLTSSITTNGSIGSYVLGKLGLIADDTVLVVTPFRGRNQRQRLTLYKHDDYTSTSQQQITFNYEQPYSVMNAATVTLFTYHDNGSESSSIACTKTDNGDGATTAISCNVTVADIADLVSDLKPHYRFEANFGANGIATLRHGEVVVLDARV